MLEQRSNTYQRLLHIYVTVKVGTACTKCGPSAHPSSTHDPRQDKLHWQRDSTCPRSLPGVPV